MEQNQQKIDRRVLYTRMFLRESLLALMKEKPVARITPTELCRHAGINRNTFYSHFSSTEELLASVEDEFYETVKRSIEQLSGSGNIAALITEICQSIADNYDLCKVILSANGDKRFLEKLIHLAHDATLAGWKAARVQGDEATLESLYTFSVSGSVAIIERWVADGMPKKPAELARFLETVTFSGLQAYLPKQR
ncbi:MAG: TetR/AcrR family transcriptional regulator [Clostridiaceae bacterium]